MFKRLVTRRKFPRPLLNWDQRCDCISTAIWMKTKLFLKISTIFFWENSYSSVSWFASLVNYSSSPIHNLAFYFFWSNFQLLIRHEHGRRWLLLFTLRQNLWANLRLKNINYTQAICKFMILSRKFLFPF